MNKTLLTLSLTLIFSINLANTYAQTKTIVPTPSTGSTLPKNENTLMPSTTTNNNSTDTIGTQQSSTTTNCINVSNQGSMCGASATNWCTSHATSAECSNFNSK
jgi:hypothetical protein